MNIGNGWTREKDGKQYISIALDETFKELCGLKGVKFSIYFIPKEERNSDKSPSWNVTMYVPKDDTKKQQQPTEDIPF